MSLPTGVWKVNVNGTEGDLTIETPNQQGVFAGGVLGKTVHGFWDETSQTITFSVIVGDLVEVLTIGIFKGYLFRSPPNPAPGRDVLVTLTGFVQVNDGSLFAPARGNSRHNVFGWFAQISEVL